MKAGPASKTNSKTLFGKQWPLIMAHRGDRDHAPENSLAAFRLALDARCDIVETDLWFTSDGVLVCHHDATLERMTGDARLIGDVRLEELRRLRLHSDPGGRFRDEAIPTLDELLEMLPAGVILALELKDPAFETEAACRRLVAVIGDRIDERTVATLAFNRNCLRAIKSVAPKLTVGHISKDDPFPSGEFELLGPISPLLILNPLYVLLAHRRGQYVCVLDNRLERRLKRFVSMGVDAVLSDDPGATYAQLVEMGRRPPIDA